jgi:NADH-quinone oxidoreductase subunit H
MIPLRKKIPVLLYFILFFLICHKLMLQFFFFETLWAFVFLIFIALGLVHFFLIPNAEQLFVASYVRQSTLCGLITSLFKFNRRIHFTAKTGGAWTSSSSQKPVNFLSDERATFTANFGQSFFAVLFVPAFIETSYPIANNLFDVVSLVLLLVGVLLSVAFFTLVERKVMASSQRRKGPDLVGFWGVLQPIADGLKLVIKENAIPSRANAQLFVVAAILPFVIAFSSWIFLPLSASALVDVTAGLPLLLAFSSVGVYGIIFSGWASNSKYAFLGGLRSAAQVISYELILGFSYLCVALLTHSMNITSIVLAQEKIWYLIPLAPVAVIFLIAMLAETNRTPFDLPEAEAELVAGYNVEYSALFFAFFFLAEYANMLLMSAIFVLLFLGGWLPMSVFFLVIPGSLAFVLKTLFLVVFFVVVRAAFPRVRYDQLMLFSWKVLLPIEFGLFFLYVGLIASIETLPIF